MFNQCEQYRNEFKEMERIHLDEMRYYKVEEDLSYPSITSVISFINRNKFAEWRARVGNEEANKISKQATTRGTKFHRVAEVYLQNGDYKSLPEWNTPLVQLMSMTQLHENLPQSMFQLFISLVLLDPPRDTF